MRAEHMDEEGLQGPVPSDGDGGRAVEAGKLVAAHGAFSRSGGKRVPFSVPRARPRLKAQDAD
ncbi:hypothetical protein LJD47_31895, partial [Escherichia coli]|nr:hypothetical protein [Escherichia coli]